mgnify:FL=1
MHRSLSSLPLLLLLMWIAMAFAAGCEGCEAPPPDDAGVAPTEDGGVVVEPDAGAIDAGEPEVVVDAGEPDVVVDAGATDAGIQDAGEPDVVDAGEFDAGVDAGMPVEDAGPTACTRSDDCAVDEACSLLVEADTEDDYTGECQALDVGGLARFEKCAMSSACESQLCIPRAQVCGDICVDDSDCGGEVCTAYPLGTTSGQSSFEPLCVVGCERQADCDEGRYCTYNGNPLKNAYDAICEAAVGAGAYLAQCNVDEDCASGMCINNICSAPCALESDCPAGQCDFFNLENPLGGTSQLGFCQ